MLFCCLRANLHETLGHTPNYVAFTIEQLSFIYLKTFLLNNLLNYNFKIRTFVIIIVEKVKCAMA